MNSSGTHLNSFVESIGMAALRAVPRTAQVRILSGPLRGKRWIAGASTNSCWLGVYELPKQKLFLSLIKPGNVVYDVGANVGFYSLLASIIVGPSGRVFSFEPLPRNLDFLRRHVEKNNLANCQVIPCAISNREGTAQFNAEADPHLTGLSDKGNLTVKVTSLDHMLAAGEIVPPDVIKCDVEGAEFDALRGATEILRKYSPQILLATHGPAVHKQSCDFLTSLGYNLKSLDHLPLAETSEVFASKAAV